MLGSVSRPISTKWFTDPGDLGDAHILPVLFTVLNTFSQEIGHAYAETVPADTISQELWSCNPTRATTPGSDGV